jgi:hypothetical protein
MAYRRHRAFLDRPIARGLALLVFVACVGAIVWLERGRLFPPEVAADDPVALCIAEREGQIDELVNQGRIQAGQAATFKSRARDLCAGAGQPAGQPLPGQAPR